MQDEYQARGEFKNAKSVYTIHNIAFQGRFWPEVLNDLSLPEATKEKLAFQDGYSKVFTETTPLDDDEKISDLEIGTYNKINWMKVSSMSWYLLLCIQMVCRLHVRWLQSNESAQSICYAVALLVIQS